MFVHFNDFIKMAAEKKFFYDHFGQEDICGLFTIGHIFAVFLFFGLGFLFLRFARKLNEKQSKIFHIGVAVLVTLMEFIKIGLRVYKNQWLDSWVPLYYCSLFIFAIWASLSRWQPLARMGYSFITMGGIAAAVFFTLYPSTSLAIFPIWHPSSIHSFLYHLIMFCTGILFLMKKLYVPKKSDAILYFVFILIACIPSLILNENYGTNCMFLNHAFQLPILDPIINYSKKLYIAVVFLAQASLMFWGNYLLYLGLPKLTQKINKKLKKENDVCGHSST